MGRSDPILKSFYKSYISPKGKTALLGFTNNDFFEGDLYDKQLDNWNINTDWQLGQTYDTIISLRCPYFARDPEGFIEKCYEHLNPGGLLYVDWGLGDHWRKFENYKIGWVKNGEQEYAYGEDNLLWSTVWDDSFQTDSQFLTFSNRVKRFGYLDVRRAVYEEIPQVLKFNFLDKYFISSYKLLTLWEDRPQLYMLVCGMKK